MVKSADLVDILKSTRKGLHLVDERGRPMAFPTRQDYVQNLQEHGLVVDEAGFVDDDRLTEAVYLDWLFRPQVGCVFAQLLARPIYRTGVRTVVARGSSGTGDPSELAIQTAHLAEESVRDASDQAMSVLLPQVRDPVVLANFVWQLAKQPGWLIEKEQLWRNTLVRNVLDSGFRSRTGWLLKRLVWDPLKYSRRHVNPPCWQTLSGNWQSSLDGSLRKSSCGEIRSFVLDSGFRSRTGWLLKRLVWDPLKYSRRHVNPP